MVGPPPATLDRGVCHACLPQPVEDNPRPFHLFYINFYVYFRRTKIYRPAIIESSSGDWPTTRPTAAAQLLPNRQSTDEKDGDTVEADGEVRNGPSGS